MRADFPLLAKLLGFPSAVLSVVVLKNFETHFAISVRAVRSHHLHCTV
jgi:hypothetical protein